VDGVVQLKPLTILGVTGSIGRQAMEVAAHLGIPVHGIAANRGSDALLDAALALPDAGGPVVVAAAASGPGEIIPVDSEHSALWQCLVGEPMDSVQRLILTASGGPFRGRSSADLKEVTVEDALDHPTWSMGPRITIDSATLMNKAFEVIEAHYLYGVGYDRIDVVVHPQSVVHSLVEFVDGTLKAELGDPDMRVPIQYAITYPDRVPGTLERFDLTKGALTFEAPDRRVFRCLDLGYEAGRTGRSATAVLNAADEVAVGAFLKGMIPFPAIPEIVEHALSRVSVVPIGSVDDVLDVDAEARRIATERVELSVKRG